MAEYPLRIKASIDTSQVERQLKNIKAPSLSGGGEKGQANKEIATAAQKINLGALAAGFNRLTGTLNTLSASMTGEGQRIIQTFSEVTSTTASAIQNVRSFGTVAGTAVTALELFTGVITDYVGGVQAAARARIKARSISDSEISSTSQAEARKHIESGNIDELRDLVANLRTRLRENKENVDRAKSSMEYTSQARADLGFFNRVGEEAGRRLGVAPEGYQTLDQRVKDAEEDYDKATAELADTRSLLAQAERALADAENSKAAADATAAREAEEAAAQAAEEAAKNAQIQETLAAQTENIIAARRGELSLRKDVENGDMGALQSRLESVQQNIATLESMGPLSENLQSLLQQSYSMQDYLTGTIDNLKEKKQEKEKEEKELPSWLDGFEDRTNDWFHGIGGSLGGENSLQNDEYRVLQEIERLVREQTSYAKQTATAVI